MEDSRKTKHLRMITEQDQIFSLKVSLTVNKSAVMFPLFRNNSINLQYKSIGLHLLGRNIAADVLYSENNYSMIWMIIASSLFSVNGRGDVCDDDYDGDLILDLHDDCPTHRNITTIDFRTLILIPLDPIGVSQRDPRWVVKNNVYLVSFLL